MSPKDILRVLKSKVETDISTQEKEAVVSEICETPRGSRVIVMEKIEGSLKMIEISARVIGSTCSPQ